MKYTLTMQVGCHPQGLGNTPEQAYGGMMWGPCATLQGLPWQSHHPHTAMGWGDAWQGGKDKGKPACQQVRVGKLDLMDFMTCAVVHAPPQATPSPWVAWHARVGPMEVPWGERAMGL